MKGVWKVHTLEPFLLMRAEGCDGFILRERLKPVSIGSIDKALVETAYDLSKCSTIGPQADGITVSFLLAKGDMAADTGYADYRIDEAEDLLDLFNGCYLTKVGFLHLPGDDAAYNTLDQPWRLPEHFKTLVRPHEPIRVREKRLDELAPMDVA
jgi:hypothetical protein